MTADWRSIARRAGFRISVGDYITVALEGGSTQAIEISPNAAGTALRARSIIARRSTVAAASPESSPLRYAWERNRLSDLLGFTVDGHGRLIGESWIPLAGLEPEEFALYVNELARVSDWHEFRLAGKDEF